MQPSIKLPDQLVACLLTELMNVETMVARGETSHFNVDSGLVSVDLSKLDNS